MEFEKILKLIETVSASELTGFTLEEQGTKLMLEKHAGGTLVPPEEAQTAVPVAYAAPSEDSAALATLVAAKTTGETADGQAEPVSREEIVKAPLVGTFYAAPSEDSKPFVEVGDAVKKGQVLGIIEAMKLMNEIESEYDGVIEAMLISNEQVVEYGQPLFRIRRKG